MPDLSAESVDAVPVLGEGCLWPSVDHTYCLQDLQKKKLRNADDKVGQQSHNDKLQVKLPYKGTMKCGHDAAKKCTGQVSERKADQSPKASNDCTGKPGPPVKTKGPERKQGCCAAGCLSDHGKTANTLFNFPVHKARCSEWLQKLGRGDLLEKSPHTLRSQGYRVCSDHFEAHHITTVRSREQLTRSAAPALLKPGYRRTGKNKPAEKTLHKTKDPAQDPGDPDLFQFKVEIDWAEDPTLYGSTQVLSGFPEDQVDLPSVLHGDLTAASDSGILNHIWDSDQPVLPVCVADIKTEPDSEEEESVSQSVQPEDYIIKTEPDSDHGEESQWSQSLRPEDYNIKTEPDSEGPHSQSPHHENGNIHHENGSIYHENCNIKTEPCTEDMEEPPTRSLQHENCDIHYENNNNNNIKTEPDMDGAASTHQNTSSHHEETDIRTEPHSDSIEESLRNQVFHYENGDIKTELEGDSLTQPICCQSLHSADSYDVDSGQCFGNNLEPTTCEPDDDDVDMSYIVVKAEQESDMEEV